ncbi:MAG: nickel-dependent hydrogenase large subunit [SAR324 cluster bacterium]|nr:nickel-dependent hydrogenase large subunit [SAR324 cluster bacterium]
MAALRMQIKRIEGAAQLVQDDGGAIMVAASRPRGFEKLLRGRAPLDAVYMTQLIGADSGVSHALAAISAWEAATDTGTAQNGLLLRELLHTLSFLHANLRQFYFQALPDFIPPSALAAYKGPSPELRRVAQAMGAQPPGSWARHRFPHRFSDSEINQLAENQARALRALSLLQRMMAIIGGKFPLVMSIVPGGVTTPLREPLVFRLRTLMREIGPFLRETPLEDGLLLLEKQEETKTLGKGSQAYLSAGTIGDDTGPEESLFPKGVLFGNTLESFQPNVTENLQYAFYRVPLKAGGNFQLLEEAPQKQGAYSWIKAPLYQARRAETGALARLVITHLSGSRSHVAPLVERIQEVLGVPVLDANTTGGRILARLGELHPLVERCESLLDHLNPGQPTIAKDNGASKGHGEAVAHIEAPAGIVQHRLVLRNGRIALYDIVSASTWNGAPRDENENSSGIELALNSAGLDLRSERDRRRASQIVHSYFFSASDAVH